MRFGSRKSPQQVAGALTSRGESFANSIYAGSIRLHTSVPDQHEFHLLRPPFR